MYAQAFNLFQRLTRRWEAVHPYNAAQVLKIRHRLDGPRAAEAWGYSLSALGLGRVRVYGQSQFRHELINGEMAQYPVRVVPAGSSLEEHLSCELNRPFDDPSEPPFRPFVQPLDDGFYFGLVYRHWIADSVSVQMLLREWFARLYDPAAVRGSPVRQASDGYWRLFGARAGWRLDETILAAFRSHMRHRRVRKIPSATREDYPVRVMLREAPAGLIGQLKQRTAGEGTRLHDLLLAAVAEACHRYVPSQFRANRRDLSVGSIIDLRRHTPADLNDTFGLFLGFTDVCCRPRDLAHWPLLLRTVAAQNRVHRQRGIAPSSMMWMAAAQAMNPLVPDRNLYRFYRKELPMAGGLSNVTLNKTWAARYHPDPLREYLRVSPTGPLVPLVFSTTTLGERLFVAMTHRQSLLDSDRADAVLRSFIDRLAGLAGIGCPREAVRCADRNEAPKHVGRPLPGREDALGGRHEHKLRERDSAAPAAKVCS